MSMLGLYKILFMTELLLAEGLLAFRLIRRGRFVLRLIAAVAVCYAAAFLFPLPERVAYSWWYTSLMFVLLFCISFGALVFVFKAPLSTVAFYAITAYTVQHLAYEAFSLIYNLAGLDAGFDMYSGSAFDPSNFSYGTVLSVLIYFNVYLLVYGFSVYFLSPHIKCGDGGRIYLKKFYMIFMSALLLCIDVILNAVVVYIFEDYNKTYTVVVGIYNVLCCLLVLYIQVSMVDAGNMKEEMKLTSRLLSQSQKQYELQRESIKLINVKAHDLRHQMLRFANNGRLDSDELEEIDRAVALYDASVNTGNEALDVILTEKSILCVNKDIHLACMVENDLLGFMREGDLYALFGNMLDNAIEAVSSLAEGDKRRIALTVRRVGDMISISTENYFSGGLDMGADGLPRTSKAAEEGHGFGMLSIKVVAKKYGGTVSVVAKDNVFRMNILIPGGER